MTVLILPGYLPYFSVHGVEDPHGSSHSAPTACWLYRNLAQWWRVFRMNDCMHYVLGFEIYIVNYISISFGGNK